MRTKISTATVATLAALYGQMAFSKSELQCNHEQTKCLTESTQLTIGDRVGIFNDEGELVAEGEVNAMRGDRRAVLIQKRHGQIKRGYELATLDSKQSTSAGDMEAIKVYKEPAKMTVGASAGLANVSIGDSSPGLELTGYAQWRKWGGVQIVARGVYESMEGEVSRYGDSGGRETAPISVRGFGALGGVGYILRENKPVSLRGELGVGMMFITATVDGDAGSVSDSGYGTNIKNGVNAYGRASAGALWNVSSGWHISGDLAESLVAEARTTVLSFGVAKELK